MGELSALEQVQAIDLEIDGLRERREVLPEHSAVAANRSERASLEQLRAAAASRRDELVRNEREVGRSVAELAARIEEIDASLYSGTVTSTRELEGLNDERGLCKDKQDTAEGEQLELLEAIEEAESEQSAQAERADRLAEEGTRADEALASALAAIDAEIAGLAQRLLGCREPLGEGALAAYDRLRAKPRLKGQAITRLDGGACTSCRLKLPVLEARRIQEADPGEVIGCPQCTRIFID